MSYNKLNGKKPRKQSGLNQEENKAKALRAKQREEERMNEQKKDRWISLT